jgi:hypothetical protein
VMPLEPAQLEAGADRIVEGSVIAKESRWSDDHKRIETHAVILVDRTRKGEPLHKVEVVVQGGTVGTATQIVFGMPSLDDGELARWFLKARGDGTYRVYGWEQGKWPARFVDGNVRFAQKQISHERFATNGMVWPAAKQPVVYRIQNAGSQDISLANEIAAFDAAFQTWENVPTASLSFVNAGMTDLGVAIDGENTMLFEETTWIYGSEAAAATSLTILDGLQEADIAVNGVNFTWAICPPGNGINTGVLDLQAVLTHEIGHFSGLGHTERAFDTMYYSWKPWPGQRSLSIDDKLGLQSIYPTTGSECAITATCNLEDGERCVEHELGRLCEGAPDPVGTPCNFDRVECDNFCLFTKVNLSSGYCSKFCEVDTDCPPTHHCDDASAGSMTVKVCFEGAQPPPPPTGCDTDDACPAGQHCAAGECTFECRVPEDCGGGATCDARGTCVSVGDDGGCRAGESPSALWLLLGLASAFCLRSSRTTSRRRPAR